MKRKEAVEYAYNLLKLTMEDAKVEAEWLVALCLNVKRNDVYLDKVLSKEEEEKFHFALKERQKKVPLSYIFHSANFYGYDFEVSPNVLIPRPETEELVEYAIKNISSTDSVLDIGTGSGVIAITINKKTNAKVTAVDISKEALKLAKTNAVRNNAKVEFICSNLFEKIQNRTFDIIISNPPYISEEEYNTLDEGVKNFEPKLALVAEENGLYFYKKIINEASKHLKTKGKIFFEIGYNQGKKVADLLEKDFENIIVKKDLQGNDRIVSANLKA